MTMCSYTEVSLAQDCQVLFNGFLNITQHTQDKAKGETPQLPQTPGKPAAQITYFIKNNI